jgi:hypothetical protein
MPELDAQTIPFLVLQPDRPDSEMGIFRRVGAEGPVVLERIPVETLRAQVSDLAGSLSRAFDTEARSDADGFRLKEIVVQVEVSVEGGLNLIGTASIGGRGALTLTFSR